MDTVAFGNSNNMDYYCSLYLYLTRYLKDGHYMHPAENILKVHLAQRKFQINQFQTGLYLFRAPGHPFCPGNGLFYNSQLDITTEKERTFYREYNPYSEHDFRFSYIKDENKLIITTKGELDSLVSIWNNNPDIAPDLIYATPNIIPFNKNEYWFSSSRDLYEIGSIKIKIEDKYGNIIIEKNMNLNEQFD